MNRRLTDVVGAWFGDAVDDQAGPDPFLWDVSMTKDDAGHPALWFAIWLPGRDTTIIQTNFVVTNPAALTEIETKGLVEKMVIGLRDARLEQEREAEKTIEIVNEVAASSNGKALLDAADSNH